MLLKNKTQFVHVIKELCLACKDTEEFMPAPIYYENLLAKRLVIYKRMTGFKPDSKIQVTVEYVDGKVNCIDIIIVSTQYTKEAKYKDICYKIKEKVIHHMIPKDLFDKNTKVFINLSGSFIVGGCFSNKNSSKVERSAVSYCRYVTKILLIMI